MVASITNISGNPIVIGPYIVEHGETVTAAALDEEAGEEAVAARQRFEAAAHEVIVAVIDLVKIGGVSSMVAYEKIANLTDRMRLFVRVSK